MVMKSAFCCASLKSGTLVLGWLTLVSLIFSAVVATIVLGITSGSKPDENGERNKSIWEDFNEFGDEMSLTTYLCLLYVFVLIESAAVACLLYGTMKGRPALLLPYLVVFSLVTSSNILLFFYRFVMGVHWMHLIPKMIAIPVGIYLLCIVRSHYEELRSQHRPDKTQV